MSTGSENAVVGFLKKVSGDCISDPLLAEVARRLTVEVDFTNLSLPVVFSSTPPQDTNVIWQPTDATTGAPVGGTKIYDPATGDWVLQFQPPAPPVPPAVIQTRAGYVNVLADGVVNITITPVMPDTNYYPCFAFTSFDGTSFSLLLPPVASPCQVYVIGKTISLLTVSVLQVPAGGIGLYWRITQ